MTNDDGQARPTDRDRQASLAGRPNEVSGSVKQAYHDFYDGEHSYEESYRRYFSAEYVVELVERVWGVAAPYRLLDCGSANGQTLADFSRVGVDAWGVENSPHIHRRTDSRWLERNVLGDVRDLPFEDGAFDFTYDTCLSYVPAADLDTAVRELRRVTRHGLFFGGIAADFTPWIIEKHDLFYEVTTLQTLPDWSEVFLRNGFTFGTTSTRRLNDAWKVDVAWGGEDGYWYRSAESIKHCFYSAPTAVRPFVRLDPTRPAPRRTAPREA